MSATVKQVRQTFEMVKDELSSHAKEELEKVLDSVEGFLLLPQSAISESLRKLHLEHDIPTAVVSLNDWKKLTGRDDNLPPFPISPDTNYSPMLIVYPEI